MSFDHETGDNTYPDSRDNFEGPEVQTSSMLMCGEFQNVVLTDVEFRKLQQRFGPQVIADYIERLSCWLKNTRKRRYSHYACIITWIRKDGTIEAHTPVEAPLIEEAELRHRAQCMFNYNKREGLPEVSIEELMVRLRGK